MASTFLDPENYAWLSETTMQRRPCAFHRNCVGALIHVEMLWSQLCRQRAVSHFVKGLVLVRNLGSFLEQVSPR